MHYVTRSTLGRKMDLPVISEKREDGARVYSIAK